MKTLGRIHAGRSGKFKVYSATRGGVSGRIRVAEMGKEPRNLGGLGGWVTAKLTVSNG